MKLLLSLLLLLAIIPPAPAQSLTFIDWYYAGDSCMEVAQYEAAIAHFQRAYNLGENVCNKKLKYNIFKAYTLLGANDSACIYLSMLAKEDFVYSGGISHLLADSLLLKSALAHPTCREALAQLIDNTYAYQQRIDQPLKQALLARKDRDQQHRGKDFATNPDTRNAQRSLDAANVAWLDSVIQQRGFPTIRMVGWEAADAAWLILQHAPLAHQEKYLGTLDSLAKRGEIRWSNYAMLQDRVLLNKQHTQLYGSQVQVDAAGEVTEVPLLYPGYVHKFRKFAGMKPYEDYIAGIRAKYKQ